MSRIFNAVSCQAFLRVASNTLVRGNARHEGGEADDDHVAMVAEPAAALEHGVRVKLCSEALAGFAVLLKSHSLNDQPDTLRR